MGVKIIYEPNSILGEYGVIYLSDVEGTKPRKANFICPICNTKFVSTIDGVKRGTYSIMWMRKISRRRKNSNYFSK